jgi:hypothetical protein
MKLTGALAAHPLQILEKILERPMAELPQAIEITGVP